MFHFFRYPYEGYTPVKYVVNPVRCVEFFLCLACLTVAIILVFTLPSMTVWVKVFVTMVASAFFVITIVDIISNSYKTPIYWNSWVLFAMTGALLFFFAVGVMIATHYGWVPILIVAMVLNTVTGIIFLLDALLVLSALRKRQTVIYPAKRYSSTVSFTKKPPTPVRSRSRSSCVCNHPSCICVEETVKPPAPPAPKPKLCPVHGECECEDEHDAEILREEEDDIETTTVEKHIKTKTLFTNKRETVQEIENEHIMERIETPIRRRSSTSYGGTFPVAKDAAPLPCPANLNQHASRPTLNKKKTSALKGSTSQIIVPTATEKITYHGTDGRVFLADGTPLSETQLDNGYIGYKNPDGILYNKDGIPIISSKEPQNIMKESSRQSVKSQKLYYKNGEWYTLDGKRVPAVHKTKEGKLVSNKFPLHQIETSAGKTLYESPEGFLYTEDGTPIGYNVVTEAETIRNYDRPLDHHQIKSENSMLVKEHYPTVELCECDPSTSKIKSRDQKRSSKEMSVIFNTAELHPPESNRSASVIKATTIDKVQRSPKTESQLPCESMSGPKVETFRSKEIVRTVESEFSSECECGTVSQQSINIPQISEPTSDHTSKMSINKNSKSPPRKYSSDNKPHADIKASECECSSSEGTPTQPKQTKRAPDAPCKTPPPIVCVRSKSSERLKPEARGSRTVAISTRLVPKNSPKSQKSSSAPSSPNSKETYQRSVRSAESQRSPCVYQPQQEPPPEVYHQYIQKPCPCGNVHYQTVSTVRGTVCSCSFHSQLKPQTDNRFQQTWSYPNQNIPQPVQRSSLPQMPCIRNDCPGSPNQKRDDTIAQPSPRPQEYSEKTPLQTISECECETDTPTSNWGGGGISIGPQAPTTDFRNIAESSSEKCSCVEQRDQQKTTECESAQTSETRMVKAADIQKINLISSSFDFKK